VTLESLRVDDAAWDAFVASAPSGSFTQLTAWAAVKAVNGWTAQRVVAAGSTGLLGAQLLVRRLGPAPWSMGYVPRGPVAESFDAQSVAAFTAQLRAVAVARRLSHITIEPPVAAGDPLEGWLHQLGWRRGTPIQDARTRIIGLDFPEDQLWAGLRSKWRQYVGQAMRSGVAVVETGEEGLADFGRIYVDTARRGGFVPRAATALDDIYRTFAARGGARLLFARLPGGEAVAALMLLACGKRVVEPYGGMTAAGAEARANYLLKWEAIRSSRERGYASYDLWGLANPGIEQFKVGFGGREVRYTGAWELVQNRLLRRAIGVAQRLRVNAARRALRGHDGLRQDAGG
jgi:lipid II:glycine glycyltransferase (peptidoglycan interpeptide bridge formation enzyme)